MGMLVSSSQMRDAGKFKAVASRIRARSCSSALAGFLFLLLAGSPFLHAQDDPLNKVHVAEPASSTADANAAPKGAEKAPLSGKDAMRVRARRDFEGGC